MGGQFWGLSKIGSANILSIIMTTRNGMKSVVSKVVSMHGSEFLFAASLTLISGSDILGKKLCQILLSHQSIQSAAQIAYKEQLDRVMTLFFLKNANPQSVASSSSFADVIRNSMSFLPHNSVASESY